jgi:hypothetical protein
MLPASHPEFRSYFFLRPTLNIKNQRLTSIYHQDFFWKYRNWFFQFSFVSKNFRFSIFHWYRYWLFFVRLNFFLTHINKFIFFNKYSTFITTNVRYYLIIKYFAEKLNCSYLFGFNRAMFSRFKYWQIIYDAVDYGYKFFLPNILNIAFFIEGGIARDKKYLKYLRYRLVFLFGFGIHEWFKPVYDFKIPFLTSDFLYYSLNFIFIKLLHSIISINIPRVPLNELEEEEKIIK